MHQPCPKAAIRTVRRNSAADPDFSEAVRQTPPTMTNVSHKHTLQGSGSDVRDRGIVMHGGTDKVSPESTLYIKAP